MTTTDNRPLFTTSERIRNGEVPPVLPPTGPDAGTLAGTPASPLVELWDAAELTPDRRVRLMHSPAGYYDRTAPDDRPLGSEACAATGTGSAVWAVQVITSDATTSSAWCDACLPGEWRVLVTP